MRSWRVFAIFWAGPDHDPRGTTQSLQRSSFCLAVHRGVPGLFALSVRGQLLLQLLRLQRAFGAGLGWIQELPYVVFRRRSFLEVALEYAGLYGIVRPVWPGAQYRDRCFAAPQGI